MHTSRTLSLFLLIAIGIASSRSDVSSLRGRESIRSPLSITDSIPRDLAVNDVNITNPEGLPIRIIKASDKAVEFHGCWVSLEQDRLERIPTSVGNFTLDNNTKVDNSRVYQSKVCGDAIVTYSGDSILLSIVSNDDENELVRVGEDTYLEISNGLTTIDRRRMTLTRRMPDKLTLKNLNWLKRHNKARKKYHAMYGGSYVAMKWSDKLAASALSYAQYMARTGVWAHSDSDYGENLAWNGGPHSLPISNIMKRWVEDEEGYWGGHFTAVLWRATKYVGCGRASSIAHGAFQVCQYVTPGNCGGRSKEIMMETTTRCLPQCPPEGCF